MSFFKLKKAAMFGLDARVTLVIFSVIGLLSFAKIYSAIEESSAKKIIYEIKDVAKAVNAYKLDTESDLPIITTGIYNIDELANSTKAGAKAPYLHYNQASGADANRYFINSTAGRFLLFRANDRSATAITDDPFNDCANSAKICYLWALFESSSDGSIPKKHMKIIDKIVDDKVGFLTGKIQQYQSTGLLFRLSVLEYYP